MRAIHNEEKLTTKTRRHEEERIFNRRERREMNSGPYKIEKEKQLSLTEYLGVLQSSGLADRRPYIADENKTQEILHNSNLFVVARDADGNAIGFSRSLTDGNVCYMADLAVDSKFQGRGLGKMILKETYNVAGCKVILRSAPAAENFYKANGCKHIGNSYEYVPQK